MNERDRNPSRTLPKRERGDVRGGQELDRLPPPAFPPGYRRTAVHRPRTEKNGGETPENSERDPGSPFPTDAFYAPDAPIRRILSVDPPSETLQVDAPVPGSVQAPLTRREVAELLIQVAVEVRDRPAGRALWKPGVPPLEGAIRGLLSGYLRHEPNSGEV